MINSGMRLRFKWLLPIAGIFFLLCSPLSTCRAQGSVYGALGFGLPINSSNTVIDALGGTGLAMGGDRTISDLNPADWTWLTRARFDATLRFNYINATQGGLQNSEHNFELSGLTFGAPIGSQFNAAIAIGLVPLTDAASEFSVSDSLGTRTYISRGGANMIYAGIGARPIPAISLGVRADFITGDIRHIGNVEFNNTETDSSQFERDYTFYGIRPTFGVEIIGDSIGLRGLTIGASLSLGAHLVGTQEDIITPISSTLDTTLDTAGSGHYPGAFSAGISYKFSPRFRVEADYFTENFSSAYVFSQQSISGDPALGASTRYGIGIERAPNMNGEFGTSFGLEKWGLRLGFSYGTLPIIPTGSGGINEIAVSAGVGIPISFESLMNLSAVFGQRTPVNAGTTPKENFVRLGVDVNFSEKWFVPTRRE
jgi:hypothetical protein